MDNTLHFEILIQTKKFKKTWKKNIWPLQVCWSEHAIVWRFRIVVTFWRRDVLANVRGDVNDDNSVDVQTRSTSLRGCEAETVLNLSYYFCHLLWTTNTYHLQWSISPECVTDLDIILSLLNTFQASLIIKAAGAAVKIGSSLKAYYHRREI